MTRAAGRSDRPADRGGFLSAADRVSLDRFPDVVEVDELRRCFPVADSDRAAVIDRRYGAAARLAGGLQIGSLRLLGFVPAELELAPPPVVEYVAAQLSTAPADLAEYSTRAKTRYEHVEAAERHVGLRRTDRGDLKMLGDWLVERAMEHDRPIVLFRLACEFLRNQGLVRPGATTVERAVIGARTRAWDETHRRIAPQLVGLHDVLDDLLVVDERLGITPLVWLRRTGPTENAATIKEQLAKIERLRAVGAAEIDLSRLNPNRVRHLTGVGRRMNPQALLRLEPRRRQQILAATVVETLTERIDEVLDLFDYAIAGIDHNARVEHAKRVEATAAIADDTVRVFSTVAEIVLDNGIADADVRATILDTIGTDQFAAASQRAASIVRPQPGHLDLIITRYTRTRTFTPHVLAAIGFHGPEPADPLLSAVHLLAELNATGARSVPDDAPIEFATPRWRRLIIDSDGRIDRHAWELAVLIELRGALRGANIWVEHSRRYRNPTSYLLPDDDWHHLRTDTTAATGVPLDVTVRLDQLRDELDDHLADLDVALADADTVRLGDGHLVVTPLAALDTTPELEAIRDAVDELLPQIDLVDLLVEVNEWCGFLEHLTHADNATDRSRDHTQRLLAAIIAHGCNHGIDNMARISGLTVDQLAWTNTWYLRTSTVRQANAAIANHQLDQPITAHWGDGTLSSSDGQRFPINVRTPRARRNRRYFTGTGATIYTWTSDRHAQYGTRVIPTTAREATYVLDAIFDNETNLEIEEHTTDTAGYTDLVFGLFDLCGLRFSPRIRDLADQRLWRLPATTRTGPAASLLEHPIRPEWIEARWDDMLRVAATIRHGYLPASLLVARLQASARQNQLSQAIQEYGRIIKTISILRYLHNPTHRRRIHQQLNKGESLHALRRALFFANLGRLRHRDPDDQDLQGECLTVLTNAIICWNTIYTQAAIEHLTATSPVPDDIITRLSPASHDHINFHGRYDFTNLNPPTPGQLRPLRNRPISSI
jgi:TnpA family transposase